MKNEMNDIDNPKYETLESSTDVFNDKIKHHELRNCTAELDKNKAYGPDQIHNQMIVQEIPTLWNQPSIFFNERLIQGKFSNVWNFANIHSMPKPNEIHSSPKSYRPLAVSSCLGRVSENNLARRLQQLCINNKIFDNYTHRRLEKFFRDVTCSLPAPTCHCVWTEKILFSLPWQHFPKNDIRKMFLPNKMHCNSYNILCSQRSDDRREENILHYVNYNALCLLCGSEDVSKKNDNNEIKCKHNHKFHSSTVFCGCFF